MGIAIKIRLTKHLIALVLLFGGVRVLKSQTIEAPPPVRAIASAAVVDNLQLITIRDINLIAPTISGDIIFVSPTESPHAGQFRIFGSNQSTVRVTYLVNETIEEVSGNGGYIQVDYTLSGYAEDIQFQSILFDDNGEFNIQMNETGEYFLWVGARVVVSQATAGEYISEFTIELEYI
jgi:hypothetical protein